MGVGDDRRGQLDFCIGQIGRCAERREIRRWIIRRIEPVGIDMAQIGDCPGSARIGLAVGNPYRRIIAVGVERLDLRAILLVGEQAVELAIGELAELLGDGGVGTGRNGRRSRGRCRFGWCRGGSGGGRVSGALRRSCIRRLVGSLFDRLGFDRWRGLVLRCAGGLGVAAGFDVASRLGVGGRRGVVRLRARVCRGFLRRFGNRRRWRLVGLHIRGSGARGVFRGRQGCAGGHQQQGNGGRSEKPIDTRVRHQRFSPQPIRSKPITGR